MAHGPRRGENVSMHDRERRRELRAAVFTVDGEALVSLLRSDPWPGDVIQLIGDGLLAALAQGVTGARDLALECVTELRERDWDGDAELATALIARLGAGPGPMLRPLPVDLDQLADVLEGDPTSGGGRIDLQTGEVWPQSVFDYGMETVDEDEVEDDDDRWLWVSHEGSRAGYRDMKRFAASIRGFGDRGRTRPSPGRPWRLPPIQEPADALARPPGQMECLLVRETSWMRTSLAGHGGLHAHDSCSREPA
jgi:hypothetical protein